MPVTNCAPRPIDPITPHTLSPAEIQPGEGSYRMPLLVIGLMMVLVVSLATCIPFNSPLPERPWTSPVPTETPTPSPHPTQSSLGPPSNCPHMPLGGFYDVWRNEHVWPRLGCAVAPAEAVTGTEAYLCGAAHSLWLREKRLFIVVRSFPGPWAFVSDESGLSPDAPLMLEPVPRTQPCFPATGRHGWLAHTIAGTEQHGEWSRTSETTFNGAIQQFEDGWLLWNGNVCFVLFADGRWTMF